MEELGVIVRVNQLTEWCAGMVVVPKTDSQVRICVDLTRLNQCVKRERHPLPAIDQTLAQLAGAKVFTKLDANSGFWQIPLAPMSALLTTLHRLGVIGFIGSLSESRLRQSTFNDERQRPSMGWADWSSLPDGRHSYPWQDT